MKPYYRNLQNHSSLKSLQPQISLKSPWNHIHSVPRAYPRPQERSFPRPSCWPAASWRSSGPRMIFTLPCPCPRGANVSARWPSFRWYIACRHSWSRSRRWRAQGATHIEISLMGYLGFWHSRSHSGCMMSGSISDCGVSWEIGGG